jgi:FixJ family two-component response regulator
MTRDHSPLIEYHPPTLVWVAEDDEELRNILSEFLRQSGGDIQVFGNGQDVLEAMKKDSFDILVTDLMMPGADGIQILREAKRLHPECIVIIMTGYASLDTAIQAIRGGAYDYIQKPFKFEEFGIVIRNASEKITLIRENRLLLQRWKDAMEEVSQLRESLETHLENMMGLWRRIWRDRKDPEIELILNQINPGPFDFDWKKKKADREAVSQIEKLIGMRKEGVIGDEEFLALEKAFSQKWREGS